MSKKIIIIGNTVAADIIYGLLNSDDRYEVVCFSVDKEYITETEKLGLQVIPIEDLKEKYNPGEHSVMLDTTMSTKPERRFSIE